MEIVHTAELETSAGVIRLVSTHKGLAYVGLPRSSGRGLEGWLRRHVPGAKRMEAFAPNRAPAQQILEYLDGKRRTFDLHLDLRATPFQLDVYAEMQKIGYGETLTYAQLAGAIGRPKAVRAVGTASGANPLSLVVPCHRVVGTNGSLTGYGGGVALKARLLAMESSGPVEGRLL